MNEYAQLTENILRSGRKQGTIPSVTSGKKQRYSCRECGRSWY